MHGIVMKVGDLCNRIAITMCKLVLQYIFDNLETLQESRTPKIPRRKKLYGVK